MKIAMTVLLLLAMAQSQAGQGDAPAARLRRDPFVRHASAAPPTQAPAVAAEIPWSGQLRMTVRAGRHSMVNVDGKSVPLGGKIDGFTLVAVEERSARFARNGKIITVGLDDDPRAKSDAATAP